MAVLGLALAIVVFAAWPGLDLQVTRGFHDAQHGFAGSRSGLVMAVYTAVPWLGRLAALAGLLAWLLPMVCTARLPVRTRRSAMAIALSMLLGVGLLTNGALKEHWGRARPNAVTPFGGTLPFRPVLSHHDECRHNCSFVSGHAATGFALMSVGLLAAPARRRRWWWIGLAAGTAIGLGRVTQGGHFLSDIVFAALVMQGSHLALRLAWLRRVAARRRRRRRLDPRTA